MSEITQKNLIGINPYCRGTIQIQDKNTIYYTSGGTIIKNNLSPLQKPQKLLHLHDNNITALALSKNGLYLASGQKGTEHYKTKKAFIAIIDTRKLQMKKFFMEFEEEILDLKFSLDSKYLAATGKDHFLRIYELKNFSLIFKKKGEKDFPLLNWNLQNGRNFLILINSVKIQKFEILKKLNDENFVDEKYFMLVKNIKRNYGTTSICVKSNFFFGGTTNGEISIFDLKNNIFIDLKKISDFEITALKIFEKNKLLVSFLNGEIFEIFFDEKKKNFEILKKFEIGEKKNILEFFVNLDFPELNFFITKNGEVFIKNSKRFIFEFYKNFPFEEIIDCDFYKKKILVLFSKNGICYFWDIKKNILITKFFSENSKKKKIFSQKIFINSKMGIMVLSYSNNSIIGLDITNLEKYENSKNSQNFENSKNLENSKNSQNFENFENSQNFKISKIWEIPEAHKGKITSIYYSPKYLLTSSSKNLLRIWHSKKLTLITEFNYHNSSIEKILGFSKNPEIIISSGKDQQLIFFDLKKEKRLKNYQINNGYIKFVTELDNKIFLTGGKNCPIFFFDLDFKGNLPKKKIDEISVTNLAISENRRFLAFVDFEFFLKIWDLEKNLKLMEKKIGYMDVLRVEWVGESEVVVVMRNGSYLVLGVSV